MKRRELLLVARDYPEAVALRGGLQAKLPDTEIQIRRTRRGFQLMKRYEVNDKTHDTTIRPTGYTKRRRRSRKRILLGE